MKQLLLRFWAYAICHVDLCANWTWNPKRAGKRTLLENGKFAVTLPTAVLPRLGLWECTLVLSYLARLQIFLGLTIWPFRPLRTLTPSPWAAHRKDCFGLELSLSTKGRQNSPQLGKWDWSCHRCLCLQTKSWGKSLELRRCHVSEQDSATWLQQTAPRLHGCRLPTRPSSQVLERRSFAHVIQSVAVHCLTEKGQRLSRHVDYHTTQAAVLQTVKWGIYIDVYHLSLLCFDFPGCRKPHQKGVLVCRHQRDPKTLPQGPRWNSKTRFSSTKRSWKQRGKKVRPTAFLVDISYWLTLVTRILKSIYKPKKAKHKYLVFTH